MDALSEGLEPNGRTGEEARAGVRGRVGRNFDLATALQDTLKRSLTQHQIAALTSNHLSISAERHLRFRGRVADQGGKSISIIPIHPEYIALLVSAA